VKRAAEAFIAPVSGSGWNNRIELDGKVQEGMVNFNAIGPGYFEAMGTRFVAGRDFNTHDGQGSAHVAIVNELFAKKFLGGGDPLGRMFQIEALTAGPRYQVIGVVGDTKYTDLREDMPPIAYLAVLQETETVPFLQVVVDSAIGAAGVTSGITQVVRDINPAITVQYSPMELLIQNSLVTERLMAALSGFFGGLAVLIATIGLYGVMSYVVARRRIEIGIRMALGADRGAVIRMVVADAGRLLAIGLVAGLVLAVLGGKSASTLLYGLQPWDPATLALSAAGLGAVALLASWLPAFRASRVSPTAALRQE
jgi:putative ABC transport system permease protein